MTWEFMPMELQEVKELSKKKKLIFDEEAESKRLWLEFVKGIKQLIDEATPEQRAKQKIRLKKYHQEVDKKIKKWKEEGVIK